MSKEKVIYIGPWCQVDLCADCGELLGHCATDSHWKSSCPRCGQVGNSLVPDHVTTSRRFVCTNKRWFRPDAGHYEWSGKSEEGESLTGLMGGRIVFNPVTTIAAAGVASGLF